MIMEDGIFQASQDINLMRRFHFNNERIYNNLNSAVNFPI